MTIEDDIRAAMGRTEKNLVEHAKDILRSDLPDKEKFDRMSKLADQGTEIERIMIAQMTSTLVGPY